MTQHHKSLARAFLNGVVGAFGNMEFQEDACRAFLHKLIGAMAGAQLDQKHPSSAAQNPPRAWEMLAQNASPDATAHLIASLQQVDDIFDWKDGSRYWPEPEYRYFADKLYSTCFVGTDDAAFSAEERFLALLMIFDKDVHYPLHSHRIEEMYLVLSGTGEWSHDGENWDKLEPGSVFFNSSWQPHAIRATGEPIISMGFYLPPFSWEGGLIGDEGRDITGKI